MHTKYHRDITQQALEDAFSREALEMVIAANLGQDRLGGQVGHDEFHFDANSFEASGKYLEKNRDETRQGLEASDARRARQAFGRLTHAAQDFYAHSNYVALWLAQFGGQGWPPAEEIEPLMDELLHHRELRSGKLYYPLEVFSYVPFLRKWVMPLIPRDSHAWMNLDTPQQGEQFQYAYEAAVKRTRLEFERTMDGIAPDLVEMFCRGEDL